MAGRIATGRRTGTVAGMTVTGAVEEVPTSGGRPMFFGADGAPISLSAWSELFRDKSSKILARETVGDVEVITAWLGTDQGDATGSVQDEPPLIFGTIPWRASTGEYLDEREVFAATAAQARANHAALVAQLRAR